MTNEYYDIIAIDTEPGTLVATALLAHRGYRVLVLSGAADQDTIEGFTLVRRPFVLPMTASPVWTRVTDALGLSQMMRYRTREPKPLFQVAIQGERLDVHADPEERLEELCRVFGEDRDRIRSFYQRLDFVNHELDKLLSNDLVIPPGSFFERRELARAVVQNPFDGPGRGVDLLDAWKPGHPFRAFAEAPGRLAGGVGPGPMDALRFARLGRSWLHGMVLLDDGMAGLKRILLDRITLHGGVVRSGQQADQILIRSGRVTGVQVVGGDDVLVTRVVLAGCPAARLLTLVRPSSRPRAFSTRPAGVRRGVVRYVLNVGLEAWAVPEGMASNVILVADPSLPLGQDNLVWVARVPQADPERAVLSVAVDVPEPFDRGLFTSGEMRDRLLDRLRTLVPFLHEGLRVVSSPCDGLAPAILGKEPRPLSGSLTLWSEEWTIPSPSGRSMLGVEGLPNRTGIRRLLATGLEVLPGLGFEGEVLAGWCAAHIADKVEGLKVPFFERVMERLDL